jgi:hypothetical protein
MPRNFNLALLSAFLLLFSLASAQFQFFEQMFQGGQQQQQRQEPQNVPSDSSWYQQNYENGTFSSSHLVLPFTASLFLFPPICCQKADRWM